MHDRAALLGTGNPARPPLHFVTHELVVLCVPGATAG